MLSLIMGAENSFKGALAYNLVLFSGLSVFAAVLYTVLIGGPLAVNLFASKK